MIPLILVDILNCRAWIANTPDSERVEIPAITSIQIHADKALTVHTAAGSMTADSNSGMAWCCVGRETLHSLIVPSGCEWQQNWEGERLTATAKA